MTIIGLCSGMFGGAAGLIWILFRLTIFVGVDISYDLSVGCLRICPYAQGVPFLVGGGFTYNLGSNSVC